MVQFTKDLKRHVPYLNDKFRVRFADNPDYVAGLSKLTGGLRVTVQVVEHREGGDPSTSFKSPGLAKFEPLVFERGRSHDPAFEAWFSKVWHFDGGPGAESSLADFRRDLIIDVFNEAGQKVLSYQVFRCWVSEYQAAGDFDANANAVLIEHIKIEHEGFRRDLSVTEPQPAQFEPVVG
jgi:phage tail-like protein